MFDDRLIKQSFWVRPLVGVLSALLIALPLAPLALATEGEDFWATKNEDNLDLRVSDVGQRIVERNALDQTIAFFVSHRAINEKINVNAHANSDFGNTWIESGMLRLIRSDDELAWVLCHEIGHVLHKDMRRQRLKYRLVQVPMAVLLTLGAVATGGVLVPFIVGFYGTRGLRSGMLVFNRRQEIEADLEALTLMAKAGYNPDASTAIAKRIMSDGSALNLWRSHPKGTERFAAMAIALPEARKLYAQNQPQKPTVAVSKAPKAKPSTLAVAPKAPSTYTNDDQEIISSYPIETEGMPTQ